jgi:hypothetical protein
MKKSDPTKEMTVYEASDFWDEHDFGEFDDVQQENKTRFLLKKKKYVGIDRDLYALIKDKARAMRKPEEALINEWLTEKART